MTFRLILFLLGLRPGRAVTLNGACTRSATTRRALMMRPSSSTAIEVRGSSLDTPGHSLEHYTDGHGPRACRSAWLGGPSPWRPIHDHSRALETRAMYSAACRGSTGSDRGEIIYDSRCGIPEYQGLMWPLYGRRDARLFFRRLAGRHVSVLHRARFRRPSLPAWSYRRLLQHLDDGKRRAAHRRQGSRPAG